MKFNLLPVTGDELIGRKDEIKEIVDTLFQTPSDIARDINYQQVYVRQFLTYLEEKMVVEKINEGIYQFSDKMFEKWIRLRFE